MTETATQGNGLRTTEPPIEEILNTTENAVLELVHGSVRVSRTLLPDVVSRPTQTVEKVFDVAEQVLAASRKVATSWARFVEGGFDGAERWAS